MVTEASASQHATTTIFPSIECVDKKWFAWDEHGSEWMVLTRPPVWRSQQVSSQLVNPCVGPNRTNRWLSGEKLSNRTAPGRSGLLSCSRVTESRISIVSGFDRETAMNPLHGDHAAAKTAARGFGAETIDSHETGNPCTTLVKGRAYYLYSLRTIEVFGDRGSAE